MLNAGSMRLRTTLAATVIVTVALLLGALAFVTIVENSLTDEVRSSLRLRGRDLGALLESGALPAQVVSEPAESEFIQVLDSQGDVVAASANLRGLGPVANVASGATVSTAVPFDDERFLVLAQEVAAGGNSTRLLLGRTLEPVAEATSLVGRVLALGLPLVVGLVAGTTWIVVGWALSPVETIRREVDAITAAELHRRVQQPMADDEIARLAGTMNHMLDRLERAQARQRQFVSDTSHELRSPIASIREQAEVALAYPERSSATELADATLADALRLQQLVNDLLLLAKADEHSLALSPDAVDLDDLVLEAAERLRTSTRTRVDVSRVSAGRVMGNAASLRRAVDNLFDNAARHAASVVSISLGERKREVVLAVEDDGPGIAASDRKRVFDRFVRLDEARARERGGAGLGLSIVAEVVSAHGGSVRVGESAMGGARLEVRLPAAFSEESASSG